MPSERTIALRGRSMRVLEQAPSTPTTGAPPAVFLAGIGGVPRWLPFLDRLSETRRVVVPSLPGFPGSEAFRHLDSVYDWIVDAVEMFEALDLPVMDLVGSSVGGALAAETAAIAGARIRRLVLIAPFGLFDEGEPNADIWAQIPAPDILAALLCADPERWKSTWETPEEADAVEWQIAQTRSMEAAARFLFPFGATGVARRLHRITQPTLLARGAEDRVIPASYLARFAAGISGPVREAVIDDAGHLVELDRPEALAREIHAFLSDQEF